MSIYYKMFWLLTAITTFLRLSVIGKLGLTVDEAHYWVYSKFLDLSYYDHPPLVGRSSSVGNYFYFNIVVIFSLC